MAIALGIAGLVILVIFAAFLAAAETALVRVSRIRVKYLVEKKVDKAEKLDRLVRDPDYFLPPLLLMVLVVQLTSASLATYVTTRITGNAGIGVLVGTLVIAVFMFMFGELVPKAVASHESERVALRLTRPVAAMTWLLHPVASVFQLTARGILRLFTGESLKNELLVSDEGEIRAMVTAAEAHDIIEMEEKDMIHSVFEFSDTMVREVMVPRPDMVTLPAAATVKDALNLTIEHGFSRIPVYGSNLDEILGVLYAKDLIQYLQADELDKPVSQIVREAFIIPETKILSDLLRELRKRKVHIAMVVDEYGTMVGLVTIEDLLEEIVGEIFDEFDREINLFEKVEENRYRVDARVNLDDLNEILQIDLPDEEDVDTVGGLVLKVLGHLPVAGETFTYNGVAVRVEKVRNNRITKVLLDILPPSSEGD
ncbi:MAG TPA: hemolysin family protein [Candidatus Anoxymicrobiaceae bacterium]|jgi:putative hemolysin